MASASALLAMRESLSANRGSVASSGRPMASQNPGQYSPGLEARHHDVAVVGGDVGADQRVARALVVGHRAPALALLQGEGDGRAHRPHADPEEGDVDVERLAGALPVVERAHDPAGDGHGPDGVTERRRRKGDEVVVGEVGGAHRPARAVPVGERVVGPPVGVGTVHALAGAPHVDDVGVVLTDLVDRDPQLLLHLGELVGQEDVAGGGELVDDLDALVGVEVDGEALLAPVGVLEQHVDLRARHGGQAAGHETSHRVAPVDVLDLDHLGTPLGEDRGGSGHERLLRHLEDAYAFHDLGHCRLPCCRVIEPPRVWMAR